MPQPSNPSGGDTQSRRRFLTAGTGLTGLLLANQVPGAWAAPAARTGYPFRLGVASGDPRPDRVILWTRLAPRPLDGDGGMPQRPVVVEWELAADPRMRRVLRRGRAMALARLGHSVHVDATGLAADQEYWYRFRAAGHLSPVGRTRTAPAPWSGSGTLRFAVASCQHYEAGHYSAYRHLADEDLDFVLHLGDYIYEGSPLEGLLRQHAGPEPTDLAGYRARYGQYKSDPYLMAAHASAPFLCTWDDHEVDNDYARNRSQDGIDRRRFRARRAAAYQAFYEHLPLRRLPLGPWSDYRVYRRLRWGSLAEFSLLDTRQYRHDQPCAVPGQGGFRLVDSTCTQRLDHRRSLLGAAQRHWLATGLRESAARWNVIAQQYLMAEMDYRSGSGAWWGTDAWDGYPAERAAMLDYLRRHEVRNPVTLGGDAHTFWVTDLRPDMRDENSPVVATEFVTTSISSPGRDYSALLSENPHVRYTGNQRGYLRCTVDGRYWQSDLRGVGLVPRHSSPVRTTASYVVESGQPGAQAI
jgi:alkaline phosphatase D